MRTETDIVCDICQKPIRLGADHVSHGFDSLPYRREDWCGDCINAPSRDSIDALPGMWDESDLVGGETDQ